MQSQNDAAREKLHRGCGIHVSRKKEGRLGVRLWHQHSTSGQGLRQGFRLLLPDSAALQESGDNVRVSARDFHVYYFVSRAFTTPRSRCCRKDGYLFDKEAILEYVLTKKREYARKLKEYEKQKQKEQVRIWVCLKVIQDA